MMRRASTLRARFALWTAGLLLAALLLFGGFVYLSMRQGLLDALDDSLQLSASQAVSGGEDVSIEHGVVPLPDNLTESDTATTLRERGLTIRVLNGDGTVRQVTGAYRALPVVAAMLDTSRQTPSYTTVTDATSGDAVRVYTVSARESGVAIGLVQVAQSIEPIQATLNQLLLALLIAIPALVLLAGGGGYWLAARALAPIDTITRTAQRLSAEDLHARLNLPPGDDEVGRLASTFDGMLARIDAAFAHERRFTADASHELRTPLTAMQAIISVTRDRRRTPAEYEQALDDLGGATDRLRGLVEDLLRLARGEPATSASHQSIDLGDLLIDIGETLRPLAESRDLVISVAADRQAVVEGDRDSLIRLFVNLVDNAIKYTERGEVRVAVRRHPEQVIVTVADSGIGIAPEHLPDIFDRFYRVDSARSGGGSGLGLAIAQEIVRAHNGSIAVTSTLGHGTTMTVSLPLQSV